MRRLSLLCATAAVGLTALAATTPAKAAYNIIRWNDTGYCQLWDDTMKIAPPPGNAAMTKKPVATLAEAMAAKDKLVAKKTCKL